MSSSKSSLEVSISQSKKSGRVIQPFVGGVSLFGDAERGLLIQSSSGLKSGGLITIESGDSVEGNGGDLSILSGNSTEAVGGSLQIKSGSGVTIGSVYIDSGEYLTPLSKSSSGSIYVHSQNRLELRSGDDILISPVPNPTYTSQTASNILIYGQADNVSYNSGDVRIKGGNIAVNGTYNNRAGDVRIEGGKANNGLEGSATYGGFIEMVAYGYGNIYSDASYIELNARYAGINIHSTDRGNSSNQTGDVNIRSGGSGFMTSGSGDVEIKASSSTSGIVGDLNLLTGSTSTGSVGDINLKTGDVSNAGGNRGFLTIEGGSGFNNADGGDVYIYSGDAEQSGVAGDIIIEAGASDATTSLSSVDRGRVFIKGGAVENFDFSLLGGQNAFAGGVTIEGGSFLGLNNGNGGIWGGDVLIKGGAVSGNSILEKRGSVNLQGRAVNSTADESIDIVAPRVTTTANNGSIELSAAGTGSIESTAYNHTMTVTNDLLLDVTNDVTVDSEGSITLDANGGVGITAAVNIQMSSQNIVADSLNKVMVLGTAGFLKALPINILGHGSVSFSIPVGYHVHMIPLFFKAITYNSTPPNIVMGNLNTNENTTVAPQSTEAYEGTSPIDTNGVLQYPNIKVFAFVVSGTSFLEVDCSPYLYTSSFTYNTSRYLQLRYATANNHYEAKGIINLHSSPAAVTVNYLVIG